MNIQSRHLVFNDLHFPYHDVALWDLLCEFSAWLKPDARVWNGDLFDFYQISKFSKHIDRRGKMPVEREIAVAAIKQMRSVRKRVTKDIALPGNHEWRLTEYHRKHADVLDEIGMTVPTWWEFLRLDKMGFEIHDFEDAAYPILELGFLKVFHGDKSNKHVLETLLNEWGCSLLIGHTHRMGSRGRAFYDFSPQAFENGHLADARRLSNTYLRGIANWQQGFSVVTVDDKTGWFNVEQVRISRVPDKGQRRFYYGGNFWECGL